MRIVILLPLLFLLSCRSPQKLIEKALEKDPTILSYKDSVSKGETVGIDSITVENETVKIKAIGAGEIKLDWEVKTQTPIIKPKPTRSENRRDVKIAKEATKQAKEETKQSKEITKQETKQVNQIKWVVILLIVIILIQIVEKYT